MDDTGQGLASRKERPRLSWRAVCSARHCAQGNWALLYFLQTFTDRSPPLLHVTPSHCHCNAVSQTVQARRKAPSPPRVAGGRGTGQSRWAPGCRGSHPFSRLWFSLDQQPLGHTRSERREWTRKVPRRGTCQTSTLLICSCPLAETDGLGGQ